jgi:hypothetical protein
MDLQKVSQGESLGRITTNRSTTWNACQVQCHNSYFRRQMELRKVSQEKEKAQTENDKLMYDLERVATQNNKSQAALEKSQEEVARLQVRF